MTTPPPQTDEKPEKPKFCRDCKYRRWILSLHSDYDSCYAPQNLRDEWNLVSGEKEVFAHTAKTARLFSRYCGLEAKWFEPSASLLYNNNLFAVTDAAATLTTSLTRAVRKNRVQVSASDLGLG